MKSICAVPHSLLVGPARSATITDWNAQKMLCDAASGVGVLPNDAAASSVVSISASWSWMTKQVCWPVSELFFKRAGFTVHKTASGDEALRIISGDPEIEVLVTNYAMPGMSGAELISEAAQVRPNLKALMMTGYPNANGLADLPPDTAILVKPFRRDELITRLKSLLGEMKTKPT